MRGAPKPPALVLLSLSDLAQPYIEYYANYPSKLLQRQWHCEHRQGREISSAQRLGEGDLWGICRLLCRCGVRTEGCRRSLFRERSICTSRNGVSSNFG